MFVYVKKLMRCIDCIAVKVSIFGKDWGPISWNFHLSDLSFGLIKSLLVIKTCFLPLHFNPMNYLLCLSFNAFKEWLKFLVSVYWLLLYDYCWSTQQQLMQLCREWVQNILRFYYCYYHLFSSEHGCFNK